MTHSAAPWVPFLSSYRLLFWSRMWFLIVQTYSNMPTICLLKTTQLIHYAVKCETKTHSSLLICVLPRLIQITCARKVLVSLSVTLAKRISAFKKLFRLTQVRPGNKINPSKVEGPGTRPLLLVPGSSTDIISARPSEKKRASCSANDGMVKPINICQIFVGE